MTVAFQLKLDETHGVGRTGYQAGRKYDRLFDTKGLYRFFVDQATGDIYGAKSEMQVNFRRWYGRLNTIDQWNWTTLTPLPGSADEGLLRDREAALVATYKRRGRPRKIPNTGTLPIIP